MSKRRTTGRTTALVDRQPADRKGEDLGLQLALEARRITKSPSGTVRLQADSRRADITLDRRKRPAERLQRRLVAQVFGRPGLACRPARPRDSLCLAGSAGVCHGKVMPHFPNLHKSNF